MTTTPTADAQRQITVCQLCRKRVSRMRNGEWYHRRNGSTSCRPGEGSAGRALPIRVNAKER